MNSKSKNTNGFKASNIAFILFGLVLVLGFSYAIYANHKKSITGASANQSAGSTKSIVANADNPFAGWNSYTLPKEKLSFHYPNNWIIESNFTNNNDDGIQLTSKTDKSFEMLIGTGPDMASIENYDGNCVNQADDISFSGQSAFLDLIGFANNSTSAPSCTPASPDIQAVVLSNNSSSANQSSLFLTKNIQQPATPSESRIIVAIDFNGPKGSNKHYKTSTEIESNNSYRQAKLVIESMSY
jgi:hypothetical protein